MEVGIGLSRSQIRSQVRSLAWPAVVEMLLQMSVGIADIAMVGQLGKEAIAAVELSNRLISLILAVFTATGVGATAIVARHIGANEPDKANEAAKQSLIMCGILALPVSIGCFVFAPELIKLMLALGESPDPAVVSGGSAYLKIASYAMILAVWLLTSSAVLRGAGDTRTPMLITGAANVFNIVFNYLLIFGVGPFPAMGVAGAALSSALSRALGGLVILWVLFAGKSFLKLSLKESFVPRWDIIRRIADVGIPAAVEQGVMRGGQLLYGVIVAGLGTTAIAAHAVTLTAESLSFMPGFGFALAATTLVGQNLGAKRPDRAELSGSEAGFTAMKIMSVMGVIFFVFPDTIVGLFSRDPDVIDLAKICLRIVALSQPALAWVMVLAGSLRGAGDTRYAMYITGIGIWGVRLTLAYLFAITLGYGLVGAWVAMIIDLFVRAALLLMRYRRGKWQQIRV